MPKTTRVAGTTPKPEMLPHEKAELADLLAQAYPQEAPPDPTVEVPRAAEPEPKAQPEPKPAPAKAEPEKVERIGLTAAEHALAILEDLDRDAEHIRAAILTGRHPIVPFKHFRIAQFFWLRMARLSLYLYNLLGPNLPRPKRKK